MKSCALKENKTFTVSPVRHLPIWLIIFCLFLSLSLSLSSNRLNKIKFCWASVLHCVNVFKTLCIHIKSIFKTREYICHTCTLHFRAIFLARSKNKTQQIISWKKRRKKSLHTSMYSAGKIQHILFFNMNYYPFFVSF